MRFILRLNSLHDVIFGAVAAFETLGLVQFEVALQEVAVGFKPLFGHRQVFLQADHILLVGV